MEATFEEARAPLGIETQCQSRYHVTARATQALSVLCAIVTLIAAYLLATHAMPVRTAA